MKGQLLERRRTTPAPVPEHPLPPRWARELTAESGGSWETLPGELRACRRGAGAFHLLTVVAPGARRLTASGLEEATLRCYRALAAGLRNGAPRHPVRLWNFVPAILEPLEGLAHRYMAFNAGRYRGYREWYSARESFPRVLPTATGVGHPGEDLVIHCLAAPGEGSPVENPRQVPAYCYSERYGPLPPCFARATRVALALGEAPSLLVGGTASVCGESSLHPGDLDGQLAETLRNLVALMAAAEGTGPAAEESLLLGRFRSVRVYHPRNTDGPALADHMRDRFPAAAEVEVVHADLCRPELLLEIEGVADLGALVPEAARAVHRGAAPRGPAGLPAP